MNRIGWFHFSKSGAAHWILALILLFYLINGICYLRAQSLTFDESSFLSYAARLVKGYPEKIHPQTDNSKLPVSVINLLPRAILQVLHPGLKKMDNGESDVFAGRYMTLFFSLLTILLVYRWSAELYGRNAGLFSAFLISFCPNTIASSGLVTSDSYSMFFLLATFYFLWKFCRDPGRRYFILFSLLTALSQLVKQSLTYLYLLIPVILVAVYIFYKPEVKIKSVLLYALSFICINWLIINLGFYFRGTNMQIENYRFLSGSFLHLQHILPGWLPVPFPHAYIAGLDLSRYYDEIGGGDYLMGSYGKITILNHSSSMGFWYYYLVSLFFKTPITFLICISASLYALGKTMTGDSFFRNEFFLLVPPMFYLTYMSFFYHTQIGIRQIIFIYPFLFILCGKLISFCDGKFRKAALLAISVFLVMSVLRYWGNYYPYTNEFILDKKEAYRFVGAANLEFSQGKYFFQKYLRENPGVKMASPTPATGRFLITANDYLDVWNLHQFDWLKHVQPSGQVAYNGLLITITPADLK